MKKILFLGLTFFLIIASHAQNWEVVHGLMPSTNGTFKVQDMEANGGKIYVVGNFSGNIQGNDFNIIAGQDDGILLAMDTSGTIDWYVNLSGSGNANFKSVAINAGGKIYVGGHFAGSGSMDEKNGTAYNLGTLRSGTQEGFFMRVLEDGTIDEIITTTWDESFVLKDLDIGPNNDVLAVGQLTYRSGDKLGILTRAPFGTKTQWTKTLISTGDVKVNSISISSKGFAVVVGSYIKNISYDGGDNWTDRNDEIEEGFLSIYDAGTGDFKEELSLVNTSAYRAIDVEVAGDFMHIVWQHEGELEITANDSKVSRGANDIMVTRVSYNPTGTNKFILQWYFGIGSNSNIVDFDLVAGAGNELYILCKQAGLMRFNDTRLSNPSGSNAYLLAINPAGKLLHESVIENTNLSLGAVAAVAGDEYPYVVSSPGSFGTARLGWFNVRPSVTELYLAKNSDVEKHRYTGTDQVEKTQLSLYPNPTTGALRGSMISNARSIEMLDLTGRIVFISSTQVNAIDLSHFHSGQYILKVELIDGRSIVERVVIEKPN